MATRKWTTQYPANLDTTIQQPAVENNVHDVDSSHVNSLSQAVRALQVLVGSNNLESGSLRAQAGTVPEMTLAELNVKITDATLIDTSDSRLSDQRDAHSLLSRPLANTVPNTGEVYIWNNTSGEWEPGLPTASEIPSLTLAELNTKVTDATLIDTADSRLSDARTPTAHTHTKSDVTDFTHTHVKADVTDFSHTHTKSDVTDFTHTHTKSDITDFTHTHTKSDITDFAHTHTASEVTDFDTEVSNNTDVATNTTHRGLTNNPHSVGASDVGNTVAQWNANQIQGRSVSSDVPASGQILKWDGANISWANDDSGAGGSSTFVGLTDTPNDLSGQGSKYVAVNSGATALEFISPPSIPSNFVDLGDVPASYTGYADYFVKVKTDETGVEFIAPSGVVGVSDFASLTDTPADYSGHAHKTVRVNITEDALEFVAPSGTAGVSNFVGLDDTPSNYDSSGHYMVRVKSDLTGLEFVAPSGINFDEAFTDLTDTPADYSGYASYFVKVKPDETGVEFIAPSGINFDEAFLDLNDTPSSYSGQGGKLLVVNTAEDAVQFSGIRRIIEDEFTADSPDGNNRQTFTLTVTTAANADTPSGRDIRGVFRNGNRQKFAAATPGNREYTMPANNQVTIGGLVTDDDIEIIYGG